MKHDHTLELYPAYSLIKKIALVLHIFVESSKEKKLTTRCVYSNI